MATKKKSLRPHEALRTVQDAARGRWWKCKHDGCSFRTHAATEADGHEGATGHALSPIGQKSEDRKPVTRAHGDAVYIRETIADLRMWADALANDLPSVGATPSLLNDLLLLATRLNAALSDAHPVSEDLVAVLWKLERRELHSAGGVTSAVVQDKGGRGHD